MTLISSLVINWNKELVPKTINLPLLNFKSHSTISGSLIIPNSSAYKSPIDLDKFNSSNSFKYILFSLVENGTFYYFSDGKIEDRINLFYKVPGIRYKVETIDMNIISKEEFKDFNQSDNIFFMYIITKS